jgi:hypothetical protein
MATGKSSGILSLETDEKWPKREYDGPPRKCFNPGCGLLTRAESGECAVCIVLRRADERVARGDVQSTETNAICVDCLEPYNKTSKGSLCPTCRIKIYKKHGGRKDLIEKAERQLTMEGELNVESAN